VIRVFVYETRASRTFRKRGIGCNIVLCVVKWLPRLPRLTGNPQTGAYSQLFNERRFRIGNSLTNREVWGVYKVEAPGVLFHRRSLSKYLRTRRVYAFKHSDVSQPATWMNSKL